METLQKIFHTSSDKVAVVTNADRGYAYSAVRQILIQEPRWTVYLTCADAARGEDAVRRLKEENKLTAHFLQLDTDSTDSITKARDFISTKHPKGIHSLVINTGEFANVRAITEAAVTAESLEPEAGRESPKPAVTASSNKFLYDKANIDKVIRTSYYAAFNVCQGLLPLLGENSRVVLVSSRLAQMAFVNSTTDTQQKFANCTMADDVTHMMESFLTTNPDTLYETAGWMAKAPETQLTPRYLLGAIYPFGIAKLGLNLLTQIYQRQFDAEKHTQHNLINACCPGITLTESAQTGGLVTADEGADTIVYLALLPKESGLRGQFVAERKILDPFVIPDEALYR